MEQRIIGLKKTFAIGPYYLYFRIAYLILILVRLIITFWEIGTMNNEMTKSGLKLLSDAVDAGMADMVSVLYAGAAIVTVLAMLLVKNSLSMCKYRK